MSFRPVTSLVEVWIEIATSQAIVNGNIVTSLVEVWIEIYGEYKIDNLVNGHFPCGSVD